MASASATLGANSLELAFIVLSGGFNEANQTSSAESTYRYTKSKPVHPQTKNFLFEILYHEM